MPTITVPADATNYSIYSRLKVARPSEEIPNFVASCTVEIQTNATSDPVKFGDKNMTATDYGDLAEAGDEGPLREDPPIILSENYVRNDGTNAVKINLKYTAL